MTFSLVARCAETGMFGMAVASSSPAVAARCAHARAKVGAVSSQNVTDPSLGPQVLDLMESGKSASQAFLSFKARVPSWTTGKFWLWIITAKVPYTQVKMRSGYGTKHRMKMWPLEAICWTTWACHKLLLTPL